MQSRDREEPKIIVRTFPAKLLAKRTTNRSIRLLSAKRFRFKVSDTNDFEVTLEKVIEQYKEAINMLTER